MTHSDKGDLTVFYHSTESDAVTLSLSSGESPSGPISRAEAVTMIVNAIIEQRPKRVLIDISGRVHPLSKGTIDLIKDGRLTAADLVAV